MKELIEQLMQATRVDERQARGGAAVLLKAARDKLDMRRSVRASMRSLDLLGERDEPLF